MHVRILTIVSGLSYFQSVTMGLLQGVTELFPISSLGHSLLVPAWIGGSWERLVTQQQGSKTPFLAYIVALHVATALALILFYRKDWIQIVAGVGDIAKNRNISTPRSRLLALLVMATIPVGIVGLVFEHPLRTLFARPLAAAIFLLVNGGVLFVVERLTQRARKAQAAEVLREPDGMDARGAETTFDNVSFKDALLVGGSQILALFPGISRSGVTISSGLLRKFNLESATHFAFLLATPVILAAGVLKLPELFGPEGKGMGGQILVGSIVAFVSAYAAARWLTRFVRTRTLYPFAIYCVVAGVASIVRFA